MTRFERELADGWQYDDDPRADHPFGAYYHWCALLCGFSEAAVEHGLLSELQLQFAEVTTEVCDGRPSDVEREGVTFGGGRFCPWIARVISIETD